MRDVIVSATDGKDLGNLEPPCQIKNDVCEDIPSKMRLDPVKEDEVTGKRVLDIIKMIAGDL
jgi:hypothetical protein